MNGKNQGGKRIFASDLSLSLSLSDNLVDNNFTLGIHRKMNPLLNSQLCFSGWLVNILHSQPVIYTQYDTPFILSHLTNFWKNFQVDIAVNVWSNNLPPYHLFPKRVMVFTNWKELNFGAFCSPRGPLPFTHEI